MNALLNRYFVYYPTVFLRGQNVSKYLQRLRQSQWQTREQLQHTQLEKLKVLLQHAKAHVPYYARQLRGVDPQAFTSTADLRSVPQLSKEQLKQNADELMSDTRHRVTKKTTGGSTGNPVTVYKTGESIASAYAAYWRGYEWAGVGVGFRQARFWGVPHGRGDRYRARLTDWVTNRLRCSAFAFSDESLARYYEELNRFRPHYFYGYVSMLEAFARYLARTNLRLKFPLRCVITTSEVLTDPHRRFFEEAFGCRVFNEYGCGEVGTIAHECELGRMHLNAENLVVEILDGGEPARSGMLGDIVVTELNNLCMPLIRYNLRDLGAVGEAGCACGRGLPVIEKIAGRAYDTIRNREGLTFHGEYFMYIFEELQRLGIAVSGFQVIQRSESDILVRLVMGKQGRERLEAYVTRRVRETYGAYANIQYEHVERIEREKSGKIRLIKSMTATDQAAG